VAYSFTNTAPTGVTAPTPGTGYVALQDIPAAAASVPSGGASVATSGGTYQWSIYTDVGVPGASGATGDYYGYITWGTGASVTGLTATVTLNRVNSSGTVQSSSSAASIATTGAKLAFSFTSLNLGTWASGDRLRIDIKATNTSTMTAGTMALAVNDGTSSITVPWDTNKLVAPESIDRAAWTKTNASVTADATTAPDGTTTADKLTETAVTGQHFINQIISRGSNSTWTISVFGKAVERSRVILEIDDSPATGQEAYATFDISGGAPTTATGSFGVSGAITISNRVVTSYGNGWYRCEMRVTGVSGTAYNVQAYLDGSSGTTNAMVSSYAGTSGSGAYIWGLDAEPTSTASAYPGAVPGTALAVAAVASASPAVGTVTIGQTHVLTGPNAAPSSPAVATVAIGQTHVLTAASLAPGSPAVGTATIGQTHVLTGPSAATASPALGAATIGQTHALSAPATAPGSPALGAVTIGQTHVLTATAAAPGSPALTVTTLGQTHILSATAAVSTSPLIGSVAIGQTHTLAAAGVAASSPVLGSVALGQTHVLSTTAIAPSAPALGAVSIGQTHALSASAVAVAGPAVDAPSMQPVATLAASPVTTGSPAMSSVALGQTQVLGTANLSTGPPALASVSLGQTHVLAAPALATSSPSLTSPALGQTHALSVSGVTTASPDIGSVSVEAVPDATGPVADYLFFGVATSMPSSLRPSLSITLQRPRPTCDWAGRRLPPLRRRDIHGRGRGRNRPGRRLPPLRRRDIHGRGPGRNRPGRRLLVLRRRDRVWLVLRPRRSERCAEFSIDRGGRRSDRRTSLLSPPSHRARRRLGPSRSARLMR
jgi:hypothetical protein